MSGLAYWLPVVWAVIVVVAITIYVVLDGFDLGVGMLFAFEKDPSDRNVMVHTIAPVWDGNETWMILGGAVLFGVFPGGYSTLLPAFYIPIILMLLALIFRGVSFEYRILAHTEREKIVWNYGFMFGSALASFCQGAILGGYVQGVSITNGIFSGSVMDWLSPFSLLCGLAVMCGYALLGATWLVWRTGGALEKRCRRWSEVLAVAMFFCIVAVSLWTPFLNAPYLRRWTEWPNIILVSPVPLLLVVCGAVMASALRKGSHRVPFFCALGWFLLTLVGLAITVWPYAIPPSLKLWDVASPISSQLVVLGGAVILLPIVLAYTVYSYHVFRGKVSAEDATHY
ncbi:cytochrome d ubiquinol oxidase subunit II [Acetobacteraceae bacterium ESL0709]|nr:cytochrome d ubiquinol oxidase subunit II [Acetobacteraceae bacterium ESL0697]MDF7678005.1 cytochrome d ubiquinol oxidase subunit II [Acetobacteraceae bacterium ESL0709]